MWLTRKQLRAAIILATISLVMALSAQADRPENGTVLKRTTYSGAGIWRVFNETNNDAVVMLVSPVRPSSFIVLYVRARSQAEVHNVRANPIGYRAAYRLGSDYNHATGAFATPSGSFLSEGAILFLPASTGGTDWRLTISDMMNEFEKVEDVVLAKYFSGDPLPIQKPKLLTEPSKPKPLAPPIPELNDKPMFPHITVEPIAPIAMPNESFTPRKLQRWNPPDYSLNPVSNIRHHRGCRYFTEKEACKATDGKACKLCGG
jgi:hypothetical protein